MFQVEFPGSTRQVADTGAARWPIFCSLFGMRFFLPALFFVASASFVCASPKPLTASDISLMLRSGYSDSDVANELQTRHFVGTFDEAAKKSLILAGASRALVEMLAAGKYSLSPEEAAGAQAAIVQEQAEQAKRRAAMEEESRRFNSLYQDRIARERAAAHALMPSAHALYPALKGDLVGCKDGSIVRFDDAALEKKKLIAIYFSAHWCGPCRKFTPSLVEYYNRVAPQHPEFEILFVSRDRSPYSFEVYMQETHMPWPAIAFDKVKTKSGILNYAGPGIPDLVLVDASGKIISNSYEGTKYLGPQKVLADLNAIFARDQVAQNR